MCISETQDHEKAAPIRAAAWGRFVFNGQIYKSKEELERVIKIYSRLLKKASNSRFWRFFLGIKKQKQVY